MVTFAACNEINDIFIIDLIISMTNMQLHSCIIEGTISNLIHTVTYLWICWEWEPRLSHIISLFNLSWFPSIHIHYNTLYNTSALYLLGYTCNNMQQSSHVVNRRNMQILAYHIQVLIDYAHKQQLCLTIIVSALISQHPYVTWNFKGYWNSSVGWSRSFPKTPWYDGNI